MKKVIVVLVATGVLFCSSNMSVFGSVSVCCQFVLVATGVWFCSCRQARDSDPAHQPADAHPTAVRALPAPGPPGRLAGPLLQPAHPMAARHEAGRVQRRDSILQLPGGARCLQVSDWIA